MGYPISLPGRPDLANAAKIDTLCLPLLQWMMRAGTAIDIDYLYKLDEEFEDNAQELRSKILKRIPESALSIFAKDPDKKDHSANDVEGEEAKDRADRGDSIASVIDFNINSSEQVAKLLFDVLLVGKGKVLKTTPDGKRISTSKKQLELLKDEHEVISDILEYREIRKLQGTYVRKLPRVAVLHPKSKVSCPVCGLRHLESSYRVHTQFVVTRTETSRVASRSPNLQNIPARSKRGRKVRAAFISTPGTKWVSADLSQIELRILADHALEKKMLWVYERNLDIHTQTAMWAFGKDKPEDVDELEERYPCKTVNFLIVYGGTAVGLQSALLLKGLYWELDRCEEFIGTWYRTFPDVRPYMERQIRRARHYGYCWDMSGGIRYVPELLDLYKSIVSAGERQAGNLPIQAGAAVVNKLGMVLAHERLEALYNAGAHVTPLLNVHDEIDVESEPDYVELLKDLVMVESMEQGVKELTGVELRVPIRADGKIMKNDRWEK